MRQRADIMKLAIDKGIYDLGTIRDTYNRYAEGGDLSDDDLVDWIIKEEGFNTKPEDIGDGKMTLGSGLTNPKWHELYKKRGNTWSQEDNRMAVAEEVADRRKWAEGNIPNWDTLPKSAQKALLSYKYNYNFTKGNSPKLYAALENNDLYEAARQINATSKDPKFRNGLEQRREREQEWFLSDIKPHTPTIRTHSDTIPQKEQSVSTRVVSPYLDELSIRQMPVKVPRKDSYIETTTLSADEVRRSRMRKAMQDRADYSRFMDSISIQNNPRPQFTPRNRFDGGGYTRENGSPVSFDPITGNLIDQTTGQTGTLILPEVRVNARDPRKPVPTAFDRNEDLLRPMMDFVPVVGDALQAKDAVTDAVNGDYLNAGIGAGLLFVPNILEKPLKTVGKGIKSIFSRHSKDLRNVVKNAEAGRQDLISDITSEWRKERMRDAGISDEIINRIVLNQKRLATEVPFDYSKTIKEIEGLGVTTPRPFKEYNLPNGRKVTDTNTGLDVSIAKDSGDEARRTGYHEAGHYSLSSAKGLDEGAYSTNPSDPLFSPVAYDYNALGSTTITRGDAWQHQLVDYNQGLLPPKDPYYNTIMDMQFDVKKDAAAVKQSLMDRGIDEKQADRIINDIKDASYMWNPQEQDRHLKEFFHYDIMPHIKNPNNADEIEKVLIDNPDIINNNPFIKQIMTKLRPGTNKDYAKVLAGMLSTLPVVYTMSNNKQ